MNEEAKAAQETAKTSRQAIDALQGAGRFLNEVLGDAAREIGGTVADWARYYRYKNLLHIVDKAEALLAQRRREGKPTPVPPGLILPLLEGASLESDDSLQALWAALMANATDPVQRINLRKIFIETLRGLEPLDARVLSILANDSLTVKYSHITNVNLNAEEIARLLDVDPEEVKLSLQTLERYGCVLDAWQNTVESLDYGYGGFRVENPSSNFRLSHLGGQLARAVSAE